MEGGEEEVGARGRMKQNKEEEKLEGKALKEKGKGGAKENFQD